VSDVPEPVTPPEGVAPLPLEVVETRVGAFGVSGTPDVSGYGGLVSPVVLPGASPRPYGGWFDEAADRLASLLGDDYGVAVEKVVVAFGELTFHVAREQLPSFVRALRDDPELRFETCMGVSGVHWPGDAGRELHAVYHFRSMTHGGRTLRVETTCPDTDPHLPTIVSTYPTNDWHERETYDMFGIIFDGHPGLTRILMPDDWVGHPQRKDYPLGGIHVEYKGASTPPPDERREYS
jgi:NADH-quinone oxidoreductase subunit C